MDSIPIYEVDKRPEWIVPFFLSVPNSDFLLRILDKDLLTKQKKPLNVEEALNWLSFVLHKNIRNNRLVIEVDVVFNGNPNARTMLIIMPYDDYTIRCTKSIS